MNTSFTHRFGKPLLGVLSVLWIAAAIPVGAQEKPAPPSVQLPDNADQAWQQIEQIMQKMRPQPKQGNYTPEEVAELQKRMKENAGPLADTARAFIEKFPDDPRAKMARQIRLQGLMMAMNTGDASREKDLTDLIDATIADASLSDDERAQMYVMKQQLSLMKKMKEDPAAFNQEDAEKTMIAVLLDARKQFPKSQMIYTQLLMLARNKPDDEAMKIAQEIVSSEHAPAPVKQQAQDILDGKRPYNLGKPLEIKFAAVDGREVDLVKLKGKVVLIDFWATWCGPCVAELPHVKAVYDKYHDKGLEIIGISLDQQKEKLVSFTKENQMPWPQYFDGQGWSNAISSRFGIQSIPTMWLVDRNGNLADLNARNGLEQKIENLLKASTVN